MLNAAANPVLVVAADDLTGALEAAVIFAQRGMDCALKVGLEVQDAPIFLSEPVTVFDLETRHLNEKDAFRRVFAGIDRLEPRPRLIYKKTDSTLRGNIYAELDALSRFGDVMYVPAYPALGRTVDGGRLLVDGMAVEDTFFQNDLLHPAVDGDLGRLLRGHRSITVHDASTETEMEHLAERWMLDGGCAAGPCGLLHAVARLWRGGRTGSGEPSGLQRALVVCGSLHPRSREQVMLAKPLFADGKWGLETTGDEVEIEPHRLAAALGQAAASRLAEDSFDAVVVFGGDTGIALLRSMGVTALEPLIEFLPGIPICRLPDGRILITKAGGFGPADLLQQIHARLFRL